ncbi:Tol-Pal system beta propeller repeat protein TolB [Nitrincola tapanii]|uniref:Tol-Pal system protein TolB n=1 Tax=Nitrincola tapanii TaxID=1708751 RepID=A0A5A9W4V8_9GAMM|nr:Tol-Pal system beta propeller repeat protein TolB [Nitrincola tapanii]KAA0875119.1 Tol-Pal system protein TolB [Nitrincola tapanii]
MKKAWIFVLWVTLWSHLAHSQQLVVEVTQGMDSANPIAVVPFAWSGQPLNEDVAAIIGQNLERSGFFKSMARENMLSFPSTQEQVFFRDWRVQKNDYLVIGRMEPSGGDQVSVVFELYDVLKEQRIHAQQVSGSTANLRDVAHFISDIIFEQLTGIKGAFSTRIAYVTSEQLGPNQQRFRLHMADWDGMRPRTILESSEPILSPAWSFDGSKLAYVSFETSRPSVYVQHLATGQRERIQSFPGLNGAPAWSPDGRRLALTLSKDGNPEVYVLDLQSRNLERMTNNSAIDTEPFWSPDGRHLYFTSDRGGSPQIYRLDMSSRGVERVTFEGNYNARGRLTQDGRFLAMVHRGSSRRFQIAVQDLQSGRLDILTNSDYDESPSIAPNGSIIIYATQQGTRGVLAAVSLDGRIRFNMPAAQGDVREPAWSPFLR